jgi:TRAP-type uncharacterized transport system fused permease subunit
MSAFSLGLGKLLVPMVFVYAPTMLIVLPEYFTLGSFLQVSITCALGVFVIATAVSAYFMAPLRHVWRLLMALGGLLLVAPSGNSDLVGLCIVALVFTQQWLSLKKESKSVAHFS